MTAYKMDDYYTIVANSEDKAKALYLECDLGEEEGIDIQKADIDKCYMFFPLKDLPEQYHDISKYPTQKYEGEDHVEITYREAMSFHTEDEPYILSVSSDLI